ncbi:MAG: prepilin peptidase [archaeon]|jgi:preflagellin peptidase FlaK|nr:prepilin peptidase [archaeon]MDD2478009.1 A24 family peptidase C-terminal domain-containing protein [Candidatus ainarchaeum sp.]MDD3084883.1 A24 family peptidase C-terminal domain-containing protein [Candidatus ainarchaeum sp.]MDD4221163.1 A24 family peptidase C-terminal domain-containing protein [Candidatus ainarchaeum sp.]MDD4662964.1 A24 family peptidase C-terminal domain-containing protein [Candidatus ainarchaeum sp.]
MFDFTIFSFLIILVFLIVASIYDIKERIVPNFLIFILFAIGLFTNIFKSIYFNSFKFILTSLLAITISFVIFYIFWELGIFAGGDFKLLVAISALAPINPNYIGQFIGFEIITKPIFSLTLFIASVLSIAPLLILISFFHIFFKRKYLLIKDMFFTKSNFKNIIYTTLMLFLITSFLNIFNLNTPYLLIFILSIVLFLLFNKVKDYSISYFYIFLGVCYLLLSGYSFFVKNVFFISNFISILVSIIIILLLMIVYKVIREDIFSKYINLSDLKEGDILYYNYYLKNKKVIYKHLNFFQTIKEIFNSSKDLKLIVDSRYAKGVTNKDIVFLKESYNNNLVGRTIRIKKSLPFTPSILIGFILLNIFGDIIWIIL